MDTPEMPAPTTTTSNVSTCCGKSPMVCEWGPWTLDTELGRRWNLIWRPDGVFIGVAPHSSQCTKVVLQSALDVTATKRRPVSASVNPWPKSHTRAVGCARGEASKSSRRLSDEAVPGWVIRHVLARTFSRCFLDDSSFSFFFL